MTWTRAIDGYCERTDPSFWAEPVNAITNLAFLLAAVWIWPRTKGQATDRVLAAILFAIGIGSFLFHTFAQAWAGLADTVPIGLFIVVYIFAACRDYIGLAGLWAIAATVFFTLMLAVGVNQMAAAMPDLGANAAYIGTCTLIFGFGVGMMRGNPRTGGGLLIGSGVLALSIASRMLDMRLCPAFPVGTHFLWHLLNAGMLAWMIEVHLRHGTRLDAAGTAR